MLDPAESGGDFGRYEKQCQLPNPWDLFRSFGWRVRATAGYRATAGGYRRLSADRRNHRYGDAARNVVIGCAVQHHRYPG